MSINSKQKLSGDIGSASTLSGKAAIGNTYNGGGVDIETVEKIVEDYLEANPPAAGEQGPKGDKGDKGDPGEQGPKGDPGEGGSGVQGDWNQNDSTQPDYIQNRTHWIELTQGSAEFDGNIDAYEHYDLDDGVTGVKISDTIISMDSIIGSELVYASNVDLNSGNSISEYTASITITEDLIQQIDLTPSIILIQVFAPFGVPILMVVPCDMSELGVPWTEGTYFIHSGFGDQYVYTKSVSCLSGYVETVHKIDDKFLPYSSIDIENLANDMVGKRGSDNSEIFNDYVNNKASGDYSHAEGRGTTASGKYSHAEGDYTTASGDYSHAEGRGTTASGYSSHAEGSNTVASYNEAHAEGLSTKASGYASHAEGYGTKASGEFQHVQGQNNIEDTKNKYAHIVGNGKDLNTHSNAHTLDWDGNAWFQGDVYVSSTSGKNRDEGSKKLATEEFVQNLIGDIEAALASI